MTRLVSLQMNGEGDLELDENGLPVYAEPPTGDVVLATRTERGSFHGDPELGGTVASLTRGRPRTSSDTKEALRDALARYESLDVLTVDDILVFDVFAQVYISATDQPIKVQL